MSRRKHPEDLTIIPVANGYIIREARDTHSGVSIESANVFETIENALKYIAEEMGEDVNVYKAV